MFDTEQFIVAVQKEPALWDLSSKTYMDKEYKRRAWEIIGCTMFREHWESMIEQEQFEKINELKKKWKNIKDNYSRNIAEQKKIVSGDAAKKQKRYVYADVLSFLQPNTIRRETISNIGSPSSEKGNAENTSDIDEQPTHERETVNFTTTRSPPDLQRPTKKKKTTQFQDSLIQYMNRPGANATHEDNLDPDKAFLLSLLPSVQQFNEDDKFDLKMSIMQLIKEKKMRIQNHHLLPSDHVNHSSIRSNIQFSQQNHYDSPYYSNQQQHVQQQATNNFPSAQQSFIQTQNAYHYPLTLQHPGQQQFLHTSQQHSPSLKHSNNSNIDQQHFQQSKEDNYNLSDISSTSLQQL